MRVLYEISSLSEGYFYQELRAGVFRLVESTVQEILNNSDVDVTLTSYSHKNHALITRHFFSNLDGEDKLKNHFLDSWAASPFFKEAYYEILRKISQNKSRSLPNKIKRRLQAGILRALSFQLKRNQLLDKFDIYHTFYYPLPPKGEIRPRARVITIHDMIPMLYPQFFLPSAVRDFRKIMNSIDTENDWMICVSESTKKDFCRLMPVSEDRVFVVPLGASNNFQQERNPETIAAVKKKHHLPEGDYILSLSTLEPRKNLPHLIKCFFKLISLGKLPDTSLVLVGSKGWLFDDIFNTLNLSPALKERIIFTSHISDSDLSAIYSGAKLFVYPSFYEGFGLPPLEAMQCGVPVITSNISSLPEVVGDAGILINPTDEDALCEAMLKLLENQDLWKEFSQKSLERSQQFSWLKCANQTIEVYEKILARS